MDGGSQRQARNAWRVVAVVLVVAAGTALRWLLPSWAVNLRGFLQLGLAGLVGIGIVIQRWLQQRAGGATRKGAQPKAPAAVAWGPPVPVPPPPPGYRPFEPQPVDSLKWLMPVNLSPWAVAAGYAGLFCMVILPGPIAFALGVKALRDIEAHPHRRGRGRAMFGLVAGLLATIVMFAFTVLLLAEAA